MIRPVLILAAVALAAAPLTASEINVSFIRVGAESNISAGSHGDAFRTGARSASGVEMSLRQHLAGAIQVELSAATWQPGLDFFPERGQREQLGRVRVIPIHADLVARTPAFGALRVYGGGGVSRFMFELDDAANLEERGTPDLTLSDA